MRETETIDSKILELYGELSQSVTDLLELARSDDPEHHYSESIGIAIEQLETVQRAIASRYNAIA